MFFFFRSYRSKIVFPKFVGDVDNQIPVRDSVSFLGITLDKSLRWDIHIDQLRKRLNSVSFTLFMLRDQVNFHVLKVLYFANYQSLLSYGIIFWGCSIHSDNLFICQKWTFRSMLRLNYRQSCRGLFRKHNFLTFYGLYIYKILTFFHKNQNYFVEFKNVNNTRQSVPYFFPIHSSTLRERGTEYMAIKLFNVLPKHLQVISNHGTFKRIIQANCAV